MESYQQSHQPIQFPTPNDHENLSSLCDDLDSFLQELSFDDHSPAVNGTTTNATATSNLSSDSQAAEHHENQRVSTYGENFTISHDYYSDDDQHSIGSSSSVEGESDCAVSSNSQLHTTMDGHSHKIVNNESVDHSDNDNVAVTTPTPTSPTPKASSSAPLQQTHLSRSMSNTTTSISGSSDTSSIRSSPRLAPSPSLFSVSRSSSLASNNMNTGDQPQQHHNATDKAAMVLTPRTSSLTREQALNAKRTDSISSNYSQYSAGSVNNNPLSPLFSPRMHSTPNSPLAKIMESDTHPSIHELMHGSQVPSDGNNVDDDSTMTFPNYALLSELATHFVDEVKRVTKRRRIFTTAEYPTSFNGEEAVDIVRSILPTGLPSGFYLKITRALMHSSPPVICPYTYSEKSARRNTLYQTNHEVYLLMEDEIPQGVYTPLTRCYTHFCLPGQGGCYAPCCPNKPKSEKLKQNGLERQGSLSSSVASSHDTTMSRAWSATVSKEVLKNTPPQEIARQEAIHELIYTEEDYVRDLNLLDELFAKSLRDAQCIEAERRDAFCDNVFNNYLELLAIHKELYHDLRDHQSLCQTNNASGFVDQIGDIFLYHLPRFMQAYERYGPHVVLAEYAVKKEMVNNIIFQNFVHEREKQAETRKLPFRHFIILPVTRLQRYPLLIGAILKKTPDDHPDKVALTKCSALLRQIARAMDEGTVNSKNTLRIYEINDRIRCKATEPHDLQLLTPGRVLLHEGPLTRRNHMGVESTEIYTFLFDHMLVMTRRKRIHGNNKTTSDDDEYLISKRPIPMPLLHLEEATEGFSLGKRGISTTYSTTLTSHTGTLVSSTSFGSNNHPLLLHHLGRSGGDYLLFAENTQVRLAWKEKVVEAKAAFEQRDPSQQVFEIRSLSDTTFRASGGQAQYGKVTCSVQFEGSNGIRMIAIGTVAGVWMGIEGDTNSIRQVLALADVTQMAVISGPHILMILADKTLYAYALEALDPTSMKKSSEKPNRKVAQSVSYFNAGTCQGRHLVIAMRKRGLDSHFKAYEPVFTDLREPQNSKYLVTKTGLFSKMLPWFKVYKEFYVGADSFAVHFLKSRIVVVCPRGFEVIDLENLSMNRNLPDIQHPDFAFVQQLADLKPLDLIRCQQHYLLCYDAFAFLVDTHGSFVQENYAWIAWEGKPHAIAFYYPYVLAFDSRFIEIRHVETGELVQILAGVHMRCLQFTNDTFSPVIHGCMVHPFKPDYQYVFQLMANFEPPTLDHYTH